MESINILIVEDDVNISNMLRDRGGCGGEPFVPAASEN